MLDKDPGSGLKLVLVQLCFANPLCLEEVAFHGNNLAVGLWV